MPAPISVELVPHDSAWAGLAVREGQKFAAAVGSNIVAVHHIGSAAIPGIRAKPILDLMPVAASLEMLDASKESIMALGLQWWGEYGLSGRRYLTRSDPPTGRRLVHIHCYEDGSPAIARHLAFRDYLLAYPKIAAEYDLEKARCRELSPNDSHAYTNCKDAWIRKVEADALAWRAALPACSS